MGLTLCIHAEQERGDGLHGGCFVGHAVANLGRRKRRHYCLCCTPWHPEKSVRALPTKPSNTFLSYLCTPKQFQRSSCNCLSLNPLDMTKMSEGNWLAWLCKFTLQVHSALDSCVICHGLSWLSLTVMQVASYGGLWNSVCPHSASFCNTAWNLWRLTAGTDFFQFILVVNERPAMWQHSGTDNVFSISVCMLCYG